MSRKSLKRLLIKGFAFASVLRAYNISLIVLAVYLSAICVLAPKTEVVDIVLDVKLFLMILSTSLVIAGGYIINSFYDYEKDLINRPHKTLLDRIISQRSKINAYIVFNFFAVFIASSISFRAVLFFSAYIFGIWLYSHKLKKIIFLGNVIAALLAILPFFPAFVYYQNFSLTIFSHASYLFVLLLIRELIKDMENVTGDLTLDYKTIAVKYGLSVSKKLIAILVMLSLVPSLLLVYKFSIGWMKWYFIGADSLLIISLIYLFAAKNRTDFRLMHLLLKLILVMGVVSILFIDFEGIIARFY